MTSCGRVGLSLTGHSCLAPYCDLVDVRPCRRQLGAATDRRCERQLDSAISRTGVAIATPSAVSTNSSMLDSARIVTSVAYRAIPEIPSSARRRSINQPSPMKVISMKSTLCLVYMVHKIGFSMSLCQLISAITIYSAVDYYSTLKILNLPLSVFQRQ